MLVCRISYSQLNLELLDEQTTTWPSADKKKLITADNYFVNQEYLYARPVYDTLSRKYKNNLYIKYLLGICDTYDWHFYSHAEALIVSCETLKSKLPDYEYYLGKAYLANDKFNEAIMQFEKYELNALDNRTKNRVDYQISICRSAIALNNKSAVAKVTNIGAPVNSSASEYTPVLPSSENFMVFTYRGERSKGGKQVIPGKTDEKNGLYFEDIMIAEKDSNNAWSIPRPIDAINTNGHDAVVYISHDGSKLFIYRNVGVGHGDIYMSRLDGINWTIPEKVKGINSNAWEGSVCLSPDEKQIYFSSERQGGYGGRDIYVAQLLPDGNWGNVKNLGPEINTKFDEDAPFIHSDGKTLFFASTGYNTMGGYDIFRSELKLGKWSFPYNVGKPVNTPRDDKFYSVSNNGERGYYSSEARSGFGLQDIYMVEPGLFGKPTALVMVTGTVIYDNKPVNAEINVRSKLSKKDFSGKFKANSITGNYLINLPSGNEYEIMYKYLDATITKDISTAKIDTFARIDINAELFSEEYQNNLNLKIDSIALKPDNLSGLNLSYDQLLAKYGKTVIDSLYYTVQIGAYKIIENFNYSKLIGLPKAQRKHYADEITRFTIGSFTTLLDANTLLIKAKKNGLKDAFVIAVYKDKRYYFKSLLYEQILK